MTATTMTRDLPAMPVDRDEMERLRVAVRDDTLTAAQRVRLYHLLGTLNQFDREPDDNDREGRNIDHASYWRVTRQNWRAFVAAWREDAP